MTAFEIDNSKIPNLDKMSYEEEVAFWDSQDNWLEFSKAQVPSKKEVVNFRISSDLKKRLKIVARRSERSVSSLLRIWTIERLGKV